EERMSLKKLIRWYRSWRADEARRETLHRRISAELVRRRALLVRVREAMPEAEADIAGFPEPRAFKNEDGTAFRFWEDIVEAARRRDRMEILTHSEWRLGIQIAHLEQERERHAPKPSALSRLVKSFAVRAP